MRYTPAAIALSLAFAVSGSVAWGQQPVANPAAAALIAEGRAALKDGKPQAAIDAFEAALTVDPGYSPVLLDLAAAARKEGLPGKAVTYYRDAQARDPRNFNAISGEGSALAELGAVEKARASLARLRGLCGNNCAQARELAAAIERGAARPALAVDTATAKPPQN